MDWKYLFTSFNGRINREPFWIAHIVLGIARIVTLALAALIVGLPMRRAFGFAPSALHVIINLLFLYPGLALLCKRWHDREKSGWWSLILLVPIVGSIWVFVELGFLRGNKGPNRFGPDPLQR